MKLRNITAALFASTVMLGASAAFADTELTVYTAIEAEDLQRYAETFNKEHPDIKVNWVRDSTGVVTAKLLAEKNNPQADVIWGLAATSLLVLKTEGMLEPYAPKGLDQLKAEFKDSDNPPSWVGMDAWVASVCYNTVESEKLGLPTLGEKSVPSLNRTIQHGIYKGMIAPAALYAVMGGVMLRNRKKNRDEEGGDA